MMNVSDGWSWSMASGMGGFGWAGVLAVCVIVVAVVLCAATAKLMTHALMRGGSKITNRERDTE